MKNYIIGLCILLCSVFVMLGCLPSSLVEKDIDVSNSAEDRSGIPDNSGNPTGISTYGLLDLSDLEENTDYIVCGKLMDDGEQHLHYSERTGVATYGYITSTLEITASYKGDLSVGDKITLGEEYYIDKFEGEDFVFNDSNYYPSDVGKEYLFFLKGYPANHPVFPGIYYPVGYELGRYPVPPAQTRASIDVDTYTNEQLNLGPLDSEGYRYFFEEVLEKYIQPVL